MHLGRKERIQKERDYLHGAFEGCGLPKTTQSRSMWGALCGCVRNEGQSKRMLLGTTEERKRGSTSHRLIGKEQEIQKRGSNALCVRWQWARGQTTKERFHRRHVSGNCPVFLGTRPELTVYQAYVLVVPCLELQNRFPKFCKENPWTTGRSRQQKEDEQLNVAGPLFLCTKRNLRRNNVRGFPPPSEKERPKSKLDSRRHDGS